MAARALTAGRARLRPSCLKVLHARRGASGANAGIERISESRVSQMAQGPRSPGRSLPVASAGRRSLHILLARCHHPEDAGGRTERQRSLRIANRVNAVRNRRSCGLTCTPPRTGRLDRILRGLVGPGTVWLVKLPCSAGPHRRHRLDPSRHVLATVICSHRPSAGWPRQSRPPTGEGLGSVT